jgi:hypothetical protein
MRLIQGFESSDNSSMSDWLHNLPVPVMALVILDSRTCSPRRSSQASRGPQRKSARSR